MNKPIDPKEYIASMRSEIDRKRKYYMDLGAEDSGVGNLTFWTETHKIKKSLIQLTSMLDSIEKELREGKINDPESALIEKINTYEAKSKADTEISKDSLLQAKYLVSMNAFNKRNA